GRRRARPGGDEPDRSRAPARAGGGRACGSAREAAASGDGRRQAGGQPRPGVELRGGARVQVVPARGAGREPGVRGRRAGLPRQARAKEVAVPDAVIVATARTPMGKYGGQLKDVRPDDLAAIAIREAVKRAGIKPEEVEDVILGCANQAGEDNRNVARMALLLAGFPVDVPGQTVNRLCGSGMQATIAAAREIQAGAADIVVAGGVESMTRAPWVMPKPDVGFPRGPQTVYDSALGWRLVNPK